MALGLEQELSELVQPILEQFGAYLVDISVRGEHGSKIIEVFTDTDSGITADQLADISRAVSRELDQRDISAGRFRLEVSSPGLQRPLKLQRQYRKNIGRDIKVVSSADGIQKIETGTLNEVSDSFIVLKKKENQLVSIRTVDVQEAYVLPHF